MTFIRPVERKDSERIIEFAFKAQFGITSLPKNEEALLDKIEQSISSFIKQVEKPGPERYLFALEDSETNTLMGISGIKADTSIDHPLTSYHIVNENDYFWLIPSIKFCNLTEISSLFVDRPFRKKGVGRLLSFSRFLFMADFPSRFHDQIFANMRGVISDNNSVFWEKVTGRFIKIPFPEVMRRIDNHEIEYKDMTPTHPLCSLFLPQEALDVIGKTHPNTTKALELLEEEGFIYKNIIDMIDGGPILHAKFPKIKTIEKSSIQKIVSFGEGDLPYLVSNRSIDFRVLSTNIRLTEEGIILPEKSAEKLKIKKGDTLRISPLSFKEGL